VLSLAQPDVQALAEQVASAYQPRYPSVPREDLIQTAWVAMLTAAKAGRYDPTRGPARAYLARAAYFAVRRFATQTRAPVKASDGVGWRFHTADLEEAEGAEVVDCEESLGREQMRLEVQALLREVGADLDLDLAVPVLLGEARPQEIAAEAGVSRQDVYSAVARMRKRLRRSVAAERLAREMGLPVG